MIKVMAGASLSPLHLKITSSSVAVETQNSAERVGSKLCPDLPIIVASRNRCGSCILCNRPIPTGRELETVSESVNNIILKICDDTAYAFHAKSFHERAIAANVLALTTAGIYPGVSNVMAVELVRAARSESKGTPERLRFYSYTAGTGGAGPTILATSFLLLGEEVVAFNKGEKIKLRPYSGMLNIDFKKKDVYPL